MTNAGGFNVGRLFGTDGIRGIANGFLTSELALNVGIAVGRVLDEEGARCKKVLIGTDTRCSADMLESALSAGLCSVGTDVYSLGVISTPGIAFLVKREGFDAGIMISASHNPYEYNGIKIFGGDGYKLSDALEDRIQELMCKKAEYNSSTVGRRYSAKELKDRYSEWLTLSYCADKSRLKVGLDCANGSASNIAGRVFKSLCEKPYVINDEPNGININLCCGSTDMEGLKALVISNGLDVGFAFDGDADRCLCIDEKGELVDGDQILAMCSLDLKLIGKLSGNTVVGTVMTNFGFNRFCKENDIGFIPTRVGDRYVLETMLSGSYSLGGEQSGHIIFGDSATTGDGILTAVKVLSLMQRTKRPLSALASVMKKYPQELINVNVSEEGKSRFSYEPEIKKAISEAEVTLGEFGRILVRASGTEPLIRVMTEGADEQVIKDVADNVACVIKKTLSDS